jgi:hypothetical protein
LGKRKVISEEEIENMVLPSANDVLGIAVQMMGYDRISVKCQDGKERLCRIRGKLKRRVWIRLLAGTLNSPLFRIFKPRHHYIGRIVGVEFSPLPIMSLFVLFSETVVLSLARRICFRLLFGHSRISEVVPKQCD